MTLSRRDLLQGALAGAALTLLPARADADRLRPRLVVIILRGGLDGLHAVPPIGDPDYARLRGDAALAASGEEAALALDGHFALHPALGSLAEAYREGSLVALQAVATPYRERSHFDAQDLLETGMSLPHARSDGWLNRALQALPGAVTRGDLGIALSPTLPLVLRGAAPVGNWSPSRRPVPDDGFLANVERLYAQDPALAAALARARDIQAMAVGEGDEPGAMRAGAGPMAAGGKPGARGAAVVPLARAAGQFLAEPDGPSVAVLDLGGWDSHVAAFTPNGALSRSLNQLDAGLAALRERLGEHWAHTAVLVMTEFGRTARPNGTGGTDHGTATCAFVLGGAVRGGRVIADWPGLRPADLYENRDLKPTLDLRRVAKGLLIEHLRVPEAAIERSVFPDSAGVTPLAGLVRT